MGTTCDARSVSVGGVGRKQLVLGIGLTKIFVNDILPKVKGFSCPMYFA
jgi:hypothetical protein